MRAARIARERQALAVDAVLGTALVQVRSNSRNLVNRARELRFGRKPVIHGHHGNAGVASKHAADAVVRVQVAQDVHDSRSLRLARGARRGGLVSGIVVTHRDVAVRTRHGSVELFGHDRAAFDPVRATGNVVLAHLLETHARVVRVASQLVFLRQHGVHLRIDQRQYIELVHVRLPFPIGDAKPRRARANRRPPR